MSFHRLHRIRALAVAGGALGAIALTSSPAVANVEVGATAGPHTFSVNNELGVEDTPDATSLRNSVFFGLRLGFTFTDMIGVEAEAGVIPSEARDQVFDVWSLVTRAHIIAQFGADKLDRKLVPFVVFGGGLITVLSSDREEVIAKDTDEQIYVGVGAKYRVENGWGLRVDLRAIGVPSSKNESLSLDAEALLSVYKEFGRKVAPKKEEPIEEEPTLGDADNDGLMDDVDQCINEPEDADEFEDQDGCPDVDDDGDGIADTADECRMDPEDVDGFRDEDGCPDLDNDGDGIPDTSDGGEGGGCKDDPEDADGFQDEDGCPDPDNDGDGVLDGNDKCPEEMESPNGYKDNDGCDDEIPPAVKKFTGAIKGITFKTNSAEIVKSSYKTLNAAVKVLNEFTDVGLEIQGHTDDVGPDADNLTLSQQRADSVRTYMIKKGVAETRLVSVGYGETVPVIPKTTKAARAKNRRVEFKLISPSGGEGGM